MSVLGIDFETRSALDLRKVGVHKYARHPTTDVWCMAYAFDDEEPKIWVPGALKSRAEKLWLRPLLAHVRSGGEIRAWNAQFERIIWREIMVKRYGFPEAALEQFVDTAAEAAALALPRSLEDAAKVLGLPVEKDMEGRRLMLQMSRPRRPRKGEPKGALLWWDDEDRRRRLYEYCRQDVRVERAVKQKLRPLPPLEREVYLMDQRMNDRGIYVDLELVRAARAMSDRAIEEANQELAEVTGGEVTAVTQVQQLRSWVNEGSDLDLENLAKDTVRDTLAQDLEDVEEGIQRALELRQEAGKSSVAKLQAFEDSAEEDSRARGLLLYHAASTGRWGGKRVQPQNFPRPSVKDVARHVAEVLDGDYDLLDLQYPVAQVISDLLRSMIRAAPGNVLRAGDYAQIEARVLAWLAGQDDLVELFRSGGKIYETMGAYIFGKAVEDIGKDSFERQIGKNSILGAGFGMGPDRFAEQVQQQTGIVLDRGEFLITCKKCKTAGRRAGGEPRGKCCSRPDTERTEIRPDMAQQAITGYRELYARVPMFWRALEDAAKAAISEPGSVHSCGRGNMIRFTVRGQFLWCRLPSGRLLAYAKPSLRRRVVERDDGTSFTTMSIAYMGVNSLTRKWQRQYSYGGHLTENVVQATARDLMAAAMLRAERAGYEPVLTVHDEIVTESPEDFGSLEEFLEIMRTRPKWAAGLPVEVDGWEGERYRK